MFCESSAHHSISTDPKKLKKAVGAICKVIKTIEVTDKIDAIAYCGSSGAAVAYPVSILTGIPVLNIRKQNEESHGLKVEGQDYLEVNSVVIVDDFIAEGDTIKHIIFTLGLDLNYLGLILYNDAFWNCTKRSETVFKHCISHIKDMPVYTVG